MPCSECRERTLRAAAAEQQLALFAETFAMLSRKLWTLEQDFASGIKVSDTPAADAEGRADRRYLLIKLAADAPTNTDKFKDEAAA